MIINQKNSDRNYYQSMIIDKINCYQSKKVAKIQFYRQLLINNRLKKLNTITLKFNLKFSAIYNLFFER
jgi:hypothetical protein